MSKEKREWRRRNVEWKGSDGREGKRGCPFFHICWSLFLLSLFFFTGNFIAERKTGVGRYCALVHCLELAFVITSFFVTGNVIPERKMIVGRYCALG